MRSLPSFQQSLAVIVKKTGWLRQMKQPDLFLKMSSEKQCNQRLELEDSVFPVAIKWGASESVPIRQFGDHEWSPIQSQRWTFEHKHWNMQERAVHKNSKLYNDSKYMLD